MNDLFIQFMEATEMYQVDDLVNSYGNSLPNPFNQREVYRWARNARIRITRVNKEKRKSWLLTDKIEAAVLNQTTDYLSEVQYEYQDISAESLKYQTNDTRKSI